ncbi:hypothetical protein KAR91_47540 [Candidatus Pacearchaeota archaeon]|nr:hypothetical protein [Candidatus Pacearchaeota archaeon]
MLTDEQRKEIMEEANRTQNIHFLGFNKKGEEVYHRIRFVSSMQATTMAEMQCLNSDRISSVNILTDTEYGQYRAQEESTKRTKSSWRVSKSNSDV